MESNDLPLRIFADQQEPVGERVNSYFKLETLGVILKALTPDELNVIRPRRSKNLSTELKVKYACLLLVDGLLCRKSAGMKIPKEHVEMIRDLDYFLDFPWGRHCFDMTVQCIKSRTIHQLAQPTVAVQGFIHAVQLVLLDAVPAALETLVEEGDSDFEDDECLVASTLKLDKLWALDSSGQVSVIPIIPGEVDGNSEVDLSWPDEAEDPKVDYMEMLIAEGAEFCRESFLGGLLAEAPPPKSKTQIRKRKAKPAVKERSVASSSRAKKTKGMWEITYCR
ncbi:unnamed protein product, partial [Thlaspi arvense]